MSDAAVTLRPVWVRFQCGGCEERLALRLSDQFDRHRADYHLHVCPDCKAVRSYEEFADVAALIWRRRTLYREIVTALERLGPGADGPADRLQAAVPRDRIARCVRELEVLDRYPPRGAPRCDECGVVQTRLCAEPAYTWGVSCPTCGEFPMAYKVVLAGPFASESRYLRGVVCPMCDSDWDVKAALEPGAPTPWLWSCDGCGLVASIDIDVDRSTSRARVRVFSVTVASETLRRSSEAVE